MYVALIAGTRGRSKQFKRHSASCKPVLVADTPLVDDKSLIEIYDRYSSVVYSVSLRILREPSAAENVLQEVFLMLRHKSHRNRHLWKQDSQGSGSGAFG
jgi:hypothetical protein